MTIFTKRIAPVALAAAIGLGAGGAALAAQTTAGALEQAEIAGVVAARVSPAQAIRTAEAKAGGRAVDFGLEKNATTNAYEVTVSAPGGLTMVQVDPASGGVIGSTSQPAQTLAQDGIDAATIAGGSKAPVTLDAAVTAAEHAAGGRALEANYTLKAGRIAVDVGVAKDGGLQDVVVDGTDAGKLTMAQADPEQGGQGEQGDHGGAAESGPDND